MALLLFGIGACAPAVQPQATLPPQLAALPLVTLPSDVYEEVIDSLAAGLEAEYLVVEDETQICYDFESRYTAFPGYFEALSPASQEAHRSCAANGEEDYRIPVDSLRPRARIRARSSLLEYEPSGRRPTIFLSRPGVSFDGSVLVIAAGYYCGMVCATSDIFVFRRTGQGWALESKWTMFVS